MRAFAEAVGEPDQFLLALRRGADDHQQALRFIFQPGLDIDAVGPKIHVALDREVAFEPAGMFVRPHLLQPHDGRGRQSAGVRPEQGGERLGKVAGGNALQVEDRYEHLEAFRAARIGRQDRRRKADAIVGTAKPVAHTRHAYLDRANASHDRPLRQVAVPNQALPAVIGALVGMFPKKAGYFGFNSLSKQRSRAVAQNVGQSIGEGPWLNQSKNVSVGHGVSLLRWRSGGVKHPHDTPPYPFMPSPTFANSS